MIKFTKTSLFKLHPTNKKQYFEKNRGATFNLLKIERFITRNFQFKSAMRHYSHYILDLKSDKIIT